MYRAAFVTGVRVTLVLTVLTGVIYPSLVTGIAQLWFPRQANGSLLIRDGVVVGSEHIAQRFVAAHYFHPRPSAAGAGYDGAASGGSNAGPLSSTLATTFRQRAAALGAFRAGVPADMITASASGLDPHISPANAAAQVARVASARAISEARVRHLVSEHIEPRQLWLFGESRLNVLTMNLRLDSLHPMP